MGSMWWDDCRGMIELNNNQRQMCNSLHTHEEMTIIETREVCLHMRYVIQWGTQPFLSSFIKKGALTHTELPLCLMMSCLVIWLMSHKWITSLSTLLLPYIYIIWSQWREKSGPIWRDLGWREREGEGGREGESARPAKLRCLGPSPLSLTCTLSIH